MTVLDSFDEWKGFLSQKLNQAQKMGMSNETITNVAYQLGDYLAADVDPKNREERLIRELWVRANDQEQKTLANLMVRLVDDTK